MRPESETGEGLREAIRLGKLTRCVPLVWPFYMKSLTNENYVKHEASFTNPAFIPLDKIVLVESDEHQWGVSFLTPTHRITCSNITKEQFLQRMSEVQ